MCHLHLSGFINLREIIFWAANGLFVLQIKPSIMREFTWGWGGFGWQQRSTDITYVLLGLLTIDFKKVVDVALAF